MQINKKAWLLRGSSYWIIYDLLQSDLLHSYPRFLKELQFANNQNYVALFVKRIKSKKGMLFTDSRGRNVCDYKNYVCYMMTLIFIDFEWFFFIFIDFQCIFMNADGYSLLWRCSTHLKIHSIGSTLTQISHFCRKWSWYFFCWVFNRYNQINIINSWFLEIILSNGHSNG